MQYPVIAQPQYGFAPTMPMMAKGGSVEAENVRAQGRNKDTMLVHMTPREVGGLQALAMQHGGSLTINPKTGLPEAGFLDAILPIAAGFALGPAGFGLFQTALGAGAAVGGLTALVSGDLGKGLMAGLGAFGGANLGTALSTTGTQAAQSQLMTEEVGKQVAQDAAAKAAASQTLAGTQLPAPSALGSGVKDLASPGGIGRFGTAFSSASGGGLGTTLGVAGMAAPVLNAMQPTYDFPTGAPIASSNYAGPYTTTPRDVRYPTDEERKNIGSSEYMYFTPSNPIPFAEGGETATSSVSNSNAAMSPGEARVYQDIMNVQRLAGLPAIDPNRFAVMPGRSYEQFVYNPIAVAPVNAPVNAPTFTGETNYGFAPLINKEEVEKALAPNLAPKEESSRFSVLDGRFPQSGVLRRFRTSGDSFAKGGVPMLEDGGFVLTKKAVDGLGKGSNKKGQKAASRGLGAIPIKGPGTGTSDSIKTSIEGKRPALVSNGEAYVPKKQVAKRGGAKAFYALMDKAEKQAKKAKRA
jgi:hypothetical protein